MSDDALVLHPRWQAWLAENLAREAEPSELVAALVDEGVAASLARAEVAAQLASPGLAEAIRWRRRAEALELMVRLRAEHRGAQPSGHTTIERRSMPSRDELVARYWVPGVPFVATDLVTRWPAFGRWSLADLAERFGEARLEVSAGRDELDHPDAEWKQTRKELTMRELAARLRERAGNDVYVIAKNAAFRRRSLAGLLDEIDVPAELFGERLDPNRMGLWIGAAGTHTPLHHDTDNSMFCQVHGRKRFRLAPPESLPLLEQSRGVYSRWDPVGPDDLEDAPELLLELELAAGEALFIPAGWWHQVDALDDSISVSLLAWAIRNDYGWYKPGTRLAGRDP